MFVVRVVHWPIDMKHSNSLTVLLYIHNAVLPCASGGQQYRFYVKGSPTEPIHARAHVHAGAHSEFLMLLWYALMVTQFDHTKPV